MKGSWEEFLIVAHIFGVYWALIFLNNFNDYVTTAISLNYFFKDHEAKKITNIRIFCHVLSHNIGTIAWSILLLPALLFKLVFGIFDSCLSGKQNGFTRCINSMCCLCCKCYELFVDRMDESYYTISYLGSLGFWRSTKIVYYLKESNEDNKVLNGAFFLGTIFDFVSKLLISFFTLWCAKWIYDSDLTLQ